MRKFLLLISIVAASMFSTAIAAVGDVTTIVDQTFTGSPTLTDTDAYTWGSDITFKTATVDGSKNDGVYVTNATSYENKAFLTFTNPIGNASHQVNISYSIRSPKDRGGKNAYFDINYLNENNEFIFAIQEVSGGWGYTSNIITANADGTKTTTLLKQSSDSSKAHMWKAGGSTIDLVVKFSGSDVVIEVDEGSYKSYSKDGAGIKHITLSATGTSDDDRGMYIENFAVKTTEVNPTQLANYSLKYVCDGQPIDGKEDVEKSGEVGSEISLNSTETEDFILGDNKYIFVSDDANGKTVAADGSTVVTLTYRKAAIWNYTVKSNVNDTPITTASCFEGESVTAPYSRYILNEDGTVWIKSVGDTQSYVISFTPDKDGYEPTVDYSKTDITDGIFFKEAEDYAEDGIMASAATAGNRGSNYLGGYGNGVLYTLKPGKYTIKIAAFSSAKTPTELKLKAGEEEIIKVTPGTKFVESSTNSIISILEDTDITIEGTDKNNVLDYILITGTVDKNVDVTGITITGTNGEQIENLELKTNSNYQLSATITPEDATDKSVTWESSDETVATVDQDGKVTAVAEGEAVITAKSANGLTAECTITVTAASEPERKVIYSWESDGNITEVGGTATAKGSATDAVNKSTAANGNTYYTLMLSGKKDGYPDAADATGSYVNIALDKPLAEGDIISVTAFRNKNATGKNVTVEFIFHGDKTKSIASTDQFANINPDGENDPLPTTQTFTLPKSAEGSMSLDMTRGSASTNLFITKIEITREIGVPDPDPIVPEQPWEPNYPKTWDFTNWSEGTVANLKAEGSNWTNDEKGDGKTVEGCFWQSPVDVSTYKYVKANGKAIDELFGLKYESTAEKSLAIAINYQAPDVNSSFGPYEGSQYLWLAGSGINNFTIPDVPAGATIKMGVESHKISDARGVQLKIGNDILNAPDGSEVAVPTTYKEQEWLVPITASESNNVIISNTKGCHIYFITVTPPVEVESITINATGETPIETLSLKVGASYQLSATVSPDNAINKTVTWSSSNEEVATVNADGTVTTVAAGEAIITATAANGVKASCTVTVEAAAIVVESITLDKTEATVNVGETVELVATVDPAEAAVTWTSDNEEVATVENGIVTAVAAGTATITATAGDKTATCDVTVVIPVNGITLNYSEIGLFEGNSYKLIASVDPENASDKTVTWTSSNDEVATVDTDGNVKAISDGETTITASAGGKTAECKIIVKAIGEIPIEGTVIDQTFNGETILSPTNQYIWGADISSMITSDGVYLTNSDNASNSYNNREFITFSNSIGSETQKLDISHSLKFQNNRAQTPTYFNIQYINEDDNFVFGIQGVNGSDSGKEYLIYANLVVANENGDLTTTKLFDFEKTKWQNADLSVTFSETSALVKIGDNSYPAYTSTPGIKKINLSVVGPRDWNRGFYLNKLVIKATEVEPVKIANYTLDYVCDGESIKTETLIGDIDSEIILTESQKANFFNEEKTVKYIYVSDDGEGKTIAADGSTVVTLTYREAETWNYTVTNNVNSDVVEGAVFEGESTTVPYSKYILASNGTVWTKDAINKEYNFTFKPDEDNYVAELGYKEYATNGVFFTEAEDIEGVSVEKSGQIATRGSNDAGAYASEVVDVYKLKPGTYKVEIAVAGNAGATLSIYAGGEEPVVTATTNGNWTPASSEEFTLSAETNLTFQGGSGQKVLDYILITGTVGIPATGIAINGEEGKALSNLELTMGNEYQLSAALEPEYTTENDVTWESDNEEVATVDQTGKVTALGVGQTTITVSCGKVSAECVVKVYPQVGDANWNGEITITDAVEITNYVVGKTEVAEADMEFYLKGANANGDAKNRITFADASATAELALAQPATASTQSRIRAYSDDSMDALVIGRAATTTRGTTVPVTLDNSEAYVALQADIILPEGVNVDVKAGNRAAESHAMMTRKHADNHIRVVFFNSTNEAFADNDAPMFEIVTDSFISASDIEISTILASDADAKEYVLASKTGDASGVAAIGLDPENPIKVYDVNGIFVGDSMEGLQQGTYIVRQGDEVKKVRIR